MVADSARLSPPLLLFVLTPLAWISCGSAPNGEADPAVEQHFRETEQMRLERNAKSQDFQKVLLDMDQAITEYTNSVGQNENEQAQRKVQAWGNWLVTNVQRYRAELRLLLQDPESSRARQISAAALGFDRGNDKNQDTLSALVLALETEKNVDVMTNICTGIGIYASPLTPVDKLFDLVLDPQENLSVRQSAAWALLQIEIAGAPKEGFARTWGLLLEGPPITRDAKLALNALQGIGLLRDPAHMMIVVPYLKEPIPLLQQVACVAMSRMDNRKAAQYLIPLMGKTERNVNVKLYARKALQDLTGNEVDHEYDWKAWAKEFHLVGDPEVGFKSKKATQEDKK
jgi:hypothetical protein